MTTVGESNRPSAADSAGPRRVLAGAGARPPATRAFSLFELLIVIGLIGLLAALALPSLKLGKGNQMNAATRQLLDDLALARLRAINNRSQVYVVFLPWIQSSELLVPGFAGVGFSGPTFDFLTTNQAANHLLGSQLAAYAIYARRSLGDQPGQGNSRYMSEWKTLPEGVFIGNSSLALNSFFDPLFFCNVPGSPQTNYIQFPDTTPGNPFLLLPFIAFTPSGKILYPNGDASGNIRIPLATGSLLQPRTPTGEFQVVDVDALETPRWNSVSNQNHIVINFQTGRARVERLELP